MSELADRTIAALRRNREDLEAYVDGLTAVQLEARSAHEWTVAQVLSHLGSSAEIALRGLHAARGLSEALPDDFNQSVWDRWNAMTPREQAAGWRTASEQLVAAYEQLSAQERDTLRADLRFLPEPVGMEVVAAMVFDEAAVHGWDARAGSAESATIPADEAALVLEHLAGPLGFITGFLGKADRLAQPVELRVETTDPEGTYTLSVTDTVSLTDAASTSSDVLALPSESLVRLLYGRLGPMRTPDVVRLDAGDVTLDELRAVFPGI